MSVVPRALWSVVHFVSAAWMAHESCHLCSFTFAWHWRGKCQGESARRAQFSRVLSREMCFVKTVSDLQDPVGLIRGLLVPRVPFSSTAPMSCWLPSSPQQLSRDLPWMRGRDPLVVGVLLSRGFLRPPVVATAVVSGVRRDECRTAWKQTLGFWFLVSPQGLLVFLNKCFSACCVPLVSV